MKGTSKVIMGATLVMVLSLAIVLGLVLVLLAELYCSLLLRRRKTTSNTTTAGADAPPSDSSPQPQQIQDQPAAPQPLGTFYAQGVLRAPRSSLFPAVDHGKEDGVDLEKQHAPHPIGILSSSTPSLSFKSVTSPKSIEKATLQSGSSSCNGCNGGACGGGHGGGGEHLVYISNPIYDNDCGSWPSRAADTPFETPDSSPSCLEKDGSSGDDYDDDTPPLTPMKEPPAEACSVSLRDAGPLGTSGSDSCNSYIGLSLSSSGSPCTSPSW